MDLLTTAKAINGRIKELEALKSDLSTLAEKKAKNTAQYDKTLAMAIVGLKNGKSYDLGEGSFKEESTTLAEKVARGVCWKEKLEMDLAEASYKNVLKIIDLTQSQLNGYQSINRYLSESDQSTGSV